MTLRFSAIISYKGDAKEAQIQVGLLLVMMVAAPNSKVFQKLLLVHRLTMQGMSQA